MQTGLAKCGCDCFNCPTYKDNLRTMETRNKCSSGWERFLNIKLSPEKLRTCDGCSVPDEERNTYYLNCKIRKCVLLNNVENCAFCAGFPCEELLHVHSLQKITSRQEFIKITEKDISDDDYRYFIEPYAGLVHLNKIRQQLTPGDIRDYKKLASPAKFIRIDNLHEKPESVRFIYSLLTCICIEKDISYARLQTIVRKREQLIRILWTMGLYGELTDDDILELDAGTFSSQKINGMYNTLMDNLYELKKFDIHGEIIPLIEKGWLTPMGGLRKKGWKLVLKTGNDVKSGTLKTVKNYIQKLNDVYGDKAFKRFNAADVAVIEN